MHTNRQPSQGSTEALTFRLPRREADALRRVADRRGMKVGTMLRDHFAPFAALAVDLDS